MFTNSPVFTLILEAKMAIFDRVCLFICVGALAIGGFVIGLQEIRIRSLEAAKEEHANSRAALLQTNSTLIGRIQLIENLVIRRKGEIGANEEVK